MNCYNGEGLVDLLKTGEPIPKICYGFLVYLFAQQQEKGKKCFKQKNERYEASFFKQCAEDGDLSSVTVRLSDKVNRFKSLVKNPDLDPLDESIRDTLMDLANYATMSLAYLDLAKQCNDKPRGDITNASE